MGADCKMLKGSSKVFEGIKVAGIPRFSKIGNGKGGVLKEI